MGEEEETRFDGMRRRKINGKGELLRLSLRELSPLPGCSGKKDSAESE